MWRLLSQQLLFSCYVQIISWLEIYSTHKLDLRPRKDEIKMIKMEWSIIWHGTIQVYKYMQSQSEISNDLVRLTYFTRYQAQYHSPSHKAYKEMWPCQQVSGIKLAILIHHLCSLKFYGVFTTVLFNGIVLLSDIGSLTVNGKIKKSLVKRIVMLFAGMLG